jgi:hypothetical protein
MGEAQYEDENEQPTSFERVYGVALIAGRRFGVQFE